ncbi:MULTISPECIES: HNH endonuclease [unclassified Microcoleus]|uniref:HNH endonuclease n=1 Tax=unclassified Microcoleus TaxID=2642155 RepID=UPI002FCEB1AA
MAKPKRYPNNWREIALSVKENAGWRCAKCHQQCLRPGKQSNLTKSERLKVTLTVHHRNRIPEDNRLENLVALCTACHLSYHNRGQSNVSPGQLSLFPDDAIDWDIMECSLESAIENIREY